METEKEKDQRLDGVFERRRQTGRHLRGLSFDAHGVVWQDCDECGDELPDPYDYYVCVRCLTCRAAEFEEYRLAKLWENRGEPLDAAGLARLKVLLQELITGKVTPEPKPAKPAKKPRSKQLGLFDK
jgi:hypothetical protein